VKIAISPILSMSFWSRKRGVEFPEQADEYEEKDSTVESQSGEDVERRALEFRESCVESNELKKATIWMRL
jgi:hypothetical protein